MTEPTPGDGPPSYDVPLALLGDVARAVDLAEGEAGVLRVLRALASGERVATNVAARAARLPVPLAAAVLAELRKVDLVDGQRPAGLTEAGRALVATLALAPVAVPTLEQLAPVVAELQTYLDDGPEVDLTLDQSFATAETKVRRVVAMIAAGVLPTPALLAVGDDDLVTVAVDRVQRALGVRLAARLTAVDVSDGVLATLRAALAGSPSEVVVVEHDLRAPLPEALRGVHTAVMTDPPYTTDGAALFLARAVEGLRAGPGWDVLLHYGPKPPHLALDLQRALTEQALVVRTLERGFSEYLGAGVIGGRSDAYHLELADPTRARPVRASYDGPLYTADVRNRARHYTCTSCRAAYVVGPGLELTGVRDLKERGCATCGGTSFAPGRLVAATTAPTPAPAPPPAPAPVGRAPADSPAPPEVPHPTTGATERAPEPEEPAPFHVRPARPDDVPAIADYEIAIARVSFGDGAITDPAQHAGRITKALDRDPRGCLVAESGTADAAGGQVVGWLWMSINENFLTKERYATFRSLAVHPDLDATTSPAVGRALIREGLAYAAEHGVAEVTGKVHSANVKMRMLYREFGFTPQHLTMDLTLPDGGTDAPGA
ncbi:GNAT family N-acetyltransferase [Nocardioides alkalitolerans]|uniref:GNAT family N-acetyltransferase n=1 Tax=Nocardioides alkalitolerans TaxID=281714 RepID=UPI0003F6AA37|nr:GNAT family N-acetyltransferase [Nocardioides alkalitolerans]